MIKKEKNGIIYYEFEHLANTSLVNHCFSTRIGGVSKSPYNDMNLAYHMGDNPADVDENFRLISEVVGFNHQKIVMTDQNHKENHHVVTNTDKMEEPTDILISATPELVLTSYHADCVPIFYLDPVKKVIANAHAGWRGTMANVGHKTTIWMNRHFDCEFEDILIGIGPCISIDHYEVDTDIVQRMKRFTPAADDCFIQKSAEKWHLDLAKINHQCFIAYGFPPENIQVANLCTYANPDLFFSHRRDKEKRGNMSAMIALKQ